MEFLLETFLETLYTLPVLFVCYVIIELIETWSAKNTTSKLKSNGLQVLFGASIGLIPQCGFGVVATDMYSKKKLSMGALIAIYIATSDEAIPTMLLCPEKASMLLPLLLSKFLIALIVGYIVFAIEKAIEKRSQTQLTKTLNENSNISAQITKSDSNENEVDNNHINKESHDECNHEHSTSHSHEDPKDNIEEVHIGCCGHHIEDDENSTNTKAKLKRYLLHPLYHTLYIFAFILVINLALSTVIHFVGHENLEAFLTSAKPLTPLLAVLVGLIPNCAASVVLTNLFATSTLPFGALLAGLITNAGIATTVLFKQNKSLKQNFTILGILVMSALVFGYAILYIV